MGVIRRLVGAIVFLAVVILGAQIVASESGEVVTLRTFVDGDTQTTRLWIVDDGGTSWLRAGQPSSGWYQRILQNPDVEVERGGQTFPYRAFPVEGGPAAQHVNSLMFDKYGWAEQVIGMMIDRSRSVAIRLDPR